MSTLGKRNLDDDKFFSVEIHRVSSWTKSEFLSAISNQKLYEAVKKNLDTVQMLSEELNDVNEQDIDDVQGQNLDAISEVMRQELVSKFYYAGGSCRYMFQYSTQDVINSLKDALNSVENKDFLVKSCTEEYHSDEINRLYGMTNTGERFAVSAYAINLLARASSPEMIAALASRLNAQDNPSLNGYIFEWLFFPSVKKKKNGDIRCKGKGSSSSKGGGFRV
jgi:hypothetical protein